jgi:signal transduction histidine kinase
MPIAKQIIDQHGGRIEIETEIGKGATFNIFLPAKSVN